MISGWAVSLVSSFPVCRITSRNVATGGRRPFFDDTGYALYRDLLPASCRAANVEVWSWGLMPNHVHLS